MPGQGSDETIFQETNLHVLGLMLTCTKDK